MESTSGGGACLGLPARSIASWIAFVLVAPGVMGCGPDNRLGGSTWSCDCNCFDAIGNNPTHTTWVCGDNIDAVRAACERQCREDDPLTVACNVDSMTEEFPGVCRNPSPLRSGPTLATQPANAFIGSLDLFQSFGTVLVGEDIGDIQLTDGEIWLELPNGLHAAGPARIDLVRVQSRDFSIGSHVASDVHIINNGFIGGTIDAADSLTFPMGSINGWGTVDGQFVAREFAQSSTQRGYIDDVSPGEIVLLGDYQQDEIHIELFLVFVFGASGRPPVPRITLSPPKAGGSIVVDGSGSTYANGGISNYAWVMHDSLHNPIILATGPSLTLTSPHALGANALTLVVHAADGRFATQSVCVFPGGCPPEPLRTLTH